MELWLREDERGWLVAKLDGLPRVQGMIYSNGSNPGGEGGPGPP